MIRITIQDRIWTEISENNGLGLINSCLLFFEYKDVQARNSYLCGAKTFNTKYLCIRFSNHPSCILKTYLMESNSNTNESSEVNGSPEAAQKFGKKDCDF